MAHNMDMKKGLYPDEPGYSDWNIGDFKKELRYRRNTHKRVYLYSA